MSVDADVTASTQVDVSMPFMGGMKAIEHIQAYEMQHGLDPIPIVVLTAHASTLHHCYRFPISVAPVTGDRERCLQASMDDHITSELMRFSYLHLTVDVYPRRTPT